MQISTMNKGAPRMATSFQALLEQTKVTASAEHPVSDLTICSTWKAKKMLLLKFLQPCGTALLSEIKIN